MQTRKKASVTILSVWSWVIETIDLQWGHCNNQWWLEWFSSSLLWWKPLVFISQHCMLSAPHLQGDWALKASDSQWMEENAKVSTHQLIIHDAFKPCAAALCRHGNYTVSCDAMVVYYIWLSFCAESEAHVCSDRGGPPWGNEVFPFAENVAALSYMKGTMHACTVHNCVCV